MELSMKAQCAKPVSPSTIPPHLRCIACKQPLANGFHTPQGFRLCQPCVFNLHPTNGVPCPGTTDEDNDNNVDGEQQRFVCRRSCLPDTGTRLEISMLTVFCPNCDLGCSEQMNWKLVEKHLSQACDFEKVVCSFCQKEVTVCRLHLFHHNLESDFCCVHFRGHCAYCGFCGYGGDTLSRLVFLEHAKTCSQAPVDCQFSQFCCLEKPKRDQLPKHYDQSVNEHMLLMCDSIRSLERRLDHSEKENQVLNARNNATQDFYLVLFFAILAVFLLTNGINYFDQSPNSTSGTDPERLGHPTASELPVFTAATGIRSSSVGERPSRQPRLLIAALERRDAENIDKRVIYPKEIDFMNSRNSNLSKNSWFQYRNCMGT